MVRVTGPTLRHRAKNAAREWNWVARRTEAAPPAASMPCSARLAAVVGQGVLVDADDRDVHEVHPEVGSRVGQSSRPVDGDGVAARGVVGAVDDGVGARQDGFEPVAGRQVHAGPPARRHRLVPASRDLPDDPRPEVPGASRHDDAHDPTLTCSPPAAQRFASDHAVVLRTLPRKAPLSLQPARGVGRREHDAPQVDGRVTSWCHPPDEASGIRNRCSIRRYVCRPSGPCSHVGYIS